MTSGRSQVAGPRRRWARLGLAGLLAASGTLHVVRPDLYLPLMPHALPAHDVLILASGVAELVCAAALARNTRWAAPASAALLLAIFPANVHFALTTSSDAGSPAWLLAAAWLRLPLQVPLIWAAFQDRPIASGVARPRRT
ncbi:MAG: DoxX family protein [Chloroflexota bacterium]|nr:DoxX family protein [Chloroflexota bacterium]